MKRLIMLALLAPILCFAQTTVGVHLGSQHSSNGFNNVNPGAYVRFGGSTFGGYYNSERRASFYAGYTWDWQLSSAVVLSATLGGISGYRSGSVIPLAVPSITYRDDLLGGRWRVMFVPKVNQYGAAAVHLTHEWSL